MFFENAEAIVRLDKSDAKYVDVVHSDIGTSNSANDGFGMRQKLGHVDFYPNDGRKQSGCEEERVYLIYLVIVFKTYFITFYRGM